MTIEVTLPERIGRLAELANNLWWSWHPEGRTLFRMLDYHSWKMGGHNPVQQLYEISLRKLKEASDLGIPMVAIGFMYPQGYFQQRISAEGWQEEEYINLDFSKAPVTPILSSDGRKSLVEVQLEDRALHIGAWLVRLGRVSIYLIDTDIEENKPEDRQLSSRLYTSDREHRLKQEILLGIGGVRVLRMMGIEPLIWHANEGHTAFMMLERIREEVARGTVFDKALESVRKNSVFTTHTPVPAGHDIFPAELIKQYFENYWPSLGTD
ncbi:alpha-glucan family phosphorylase [Chloroflexota bacterium]